MTSPILEALPTIHVSAIAIGLTIFLGFAIISYQDFIKLKLALGDVKKRMAFEQSPGIRMGVDSDPGLFLKDDALDWDGVGWSRLKEFRGFYGPHVEQDYKKQAQDLCQIFYMFFTTYPMLGEEICDGPFSPKIRSRKNLMYGIERHNLCSVRLSKLNNFVMKYSYDLLEIARRCDHVELEERRNMFEEARKKIKLPPGVSHNASGFDPINQHKAQWEEAVVYYFNLTKQISDSHIHYRSAVSSYELGLRDFYISILRKPKIPIMIISLLFLFGVMFPPIIETVRGECKFWYPALDYFMLITCVPYLYALWLLSRNTRKFFNDK